MREFFKGWFSLDLASTIPWHVLISDGAGTNTTMLKFAKAGKLARVLRLLRIAKLNMLAHRIEDLFCGSLLAISMSLARIVVFLGLLCHWCACFWGFLGHPDRYHRLPSAPHSVDACEPGGPCESSINGSPWRRRYGLDDSSLEEQYLIALRFSTGLFTGSDMDIQPGFWAERMFVVFASFCSFILSSVILSQVIVTFHKINQEHSEQHELLRNFKEFMILTRVPIPLQAKVKRYLEFQFKSRKDIQIRQFDLMERLSPWLRKELQVHLNKNVLLLHPFFKGMSKTVLAHTCCLAESLICAPGDIVLEKGQNTGKMYFLVRGKLHIKFFAEGQDGAQDDESSVCDEDCGVLLMPPGFVGAQNLFTPDVRSYTVTSVAHSEVLTLARHDIDVVINEFPGMKDYVDAAMNGAKQSGPFWDCSARPG